MCAADGNRHNRNRAIRVFLDRHLHFLGLAAPVITVGCCLYAALAWDGGGDKVYSPLTRAISSLGNQRVSPRADLFNIGFVTGAVLLGPFIAGAGLVMRSIPGCLVSVFGVAATV